MSISTVAILCGPRYFLSEKSVEEICEDLQKVVEKAPTFSKIQKDNNDSREAA